MPVQDLPEYITCPPDAAGVYAIWPGSGVPENSANRTWHEQTMRIPLAGEATQTTLVRNVVIPTVTMFQPQSCVANGTSLIIAPGGSFLFLMMDHEGYDVARWVTTLGVTAFVLRYRLAHMPEDDADMLAFMGTLGRVLPVQDRFEERPPVGNEKVEEARYRAEEDGHQAIRFVRDHASEWGLDPQKIGIAGLQGEALLSPLPRTTMRTAAPTLSRASIRGTGGQHRCLRTRLRFFWLPRTMIFWWRLYPLSGSMRPGAERTGQWNCTSSREDSTDSVCGNSTSHPMCGPLSFNTGWLFRGISPRVEKGVRYSVATCPYPGPV